MSPKVTALDGLYNGYNLTDAWRRAVSPWKGWKRVLNGSFLLYSHRIILAPPLSCLYTTRCTFRNVHRPSLHSSSLMPLRWCGHPSYSWRWWCSVAPSALTPQTPRQSRSSMTSGPSFATFLASAPSACGASEPC